MERYRVHSRCECQALLGATLDEHYYVVSGSAVRSHRREIAPAHTIEPHGVDRDVPVERFDVGWLCPFCGRNTLRMFYVGALARLAPPPAASPQGEP